MSQKERVLAHLKAGHTISALEAMGLFGAFRLGAIIHDLRQEDWNIGSHSQQDPTNNKRRYSRYYLIGRKAPAVSIPAKHRAA